jgi:hypothetical protein
MFVGKHSCWKKEPVEWLARLWVFEAWNPLHEGRLNKLAMRCLASICGWGNKARVTSFHLPHPPNEITPLIHECTWHQQWPNNRGY